MPIIIASARTIKHNILLHEKACALRLYIHAMESFNKLTATLIIVRGIPGSGKSTLAKKLCALLGGAYYETDMFFEQTGEYIFDPTKLAEAHAWCFAKVKESLASGKLTMVANTFCQDAHMQPYMELASKHIIIQLNTSYGSVHNVPDYAVERMKEQLKSTTILPDITLG